MQLRPLRKGSKVVAGTVLGRIGKTTHLAPHVNFSIRPAGKGAPKIDPKPILDGWKLLEATAIYRAAGEEPVHRGRGDEQRHPGPPDAQEPSSSSKVLADPRLSIYACGRNDIRTGQIDARILATMEYLADNGFRLTITSLKCGHSLMTTSGNVSEHTTGDAMDIADDQRRPRRAPPGPGDPRRLADQEPLEAPGHDAAAPDHLARGPARADQLRAAGPLDHVHVGFYPAGTAPSGGKTGKQFESLLKPDQWNKLIGRIGQIQNPTVPTSPSRFSLPAHKQNGGKKSGGKGSRGD